MLVLTALEAILSDQGLTLPKGEAVAAAAHVYH